MATIGATLHSIIDDQWVGSLGAEVEVLVCAYGGSVKASREVRKVMAHCACIRLYEISEAGKPNAWNLLRKRARAAHIFFADGDVILEEGTLKRLYEALVSSELVAVASAIVPILEGASLMNRILNPNRPWVGDLCGRLYGFDNGKMEVAFQQKGFREMPKELIREDLFLSLVIGEDSYRLVPGTCVYFRPYDWREFTRMQARDLRGQRQLNKFFKNVNNSQGQSQSLHRRTLGYLNKVIHTPTMSRRARTLARTVLWSVLTSRAKRIVEAETFDSEENPLWGWAFSQHSKRPLKVSKPSQD